MTYSYDILVQQQCIPRVSNTVIYRQNTKILAIMYLPLLPSTPISRVWALGVFPYGMYEYTRVTDHHGLGGKAKNVSRETQTRGWWDAAVCDACDTLTDRTRHEPEMRGDTRGRPSIHSTHLGKTSYHRGKQRPVVEKKAPRGEIQHPAERTAVPQRGGMPFRCTTPFEKPS